MRGVDWAIVVAYIVWVVYDGLRRSKGTDKVDGYFLANRSLPWWAVGLSVMATQMSAVTIVGTTGQAYLTGLRFIHLYIGLPLAMIILSLTVVPFFTRARVYTAYEYLERRFDARTRSAASLLFLMGRAASLGVTLAAPAVVMSTILDWSIPSTVLLLSVPMVVYTSIGGVQAVAWTDVKQMFVVVFGMLAAVGILLYGILQHVGLSDALHLAGATGRLKAIDFTFDLRETYTFWSGMIGGLSGYLWISRYVIASVEVANGYELNIIAACVIGGISIAGGIGSVGGAVLGALFLGIISNALPVINISPFWQMAISGSAIILAVVLNARGERQQGRIILRKAEAA